jgi:hypothetical protein
MQNYGAILSARIEEFVHVGTISRIALVKQKFTKNFYLCYFLCFLLMFISRHNVKNEYFIICILEGSENNLKCFFSVDLL